MYSLTYAAGCPGCLASRKIAVLGRKIADSRSIVANLQNDQAQFAKCLSNMILAAARNELAGDALKSASAKLAVAIDRGKQFEPLEGNVAAIVASEVLAVPLTTARDELAGDAMKSASAKLAVAIDRGKQYESFEGEVAAIVASEVLADPQAVCKLKAFAEFILSGVVERAELIYKFAIS